MRIGIAHHFGWAVAVTADARHHVVDRRRIELIGPRLTAAPIHHDGGAHAMHGNQEPLDDAALEALVARVRRSVLHVTRDAFEALAQDLGGTVESISLRAWPSDFPTDIAVKRRPPYESRADSVMYLETMAEIGGSRGWAVHHFDAANVEQRAAAVLGERSDDVLYGPRARLGPPWSKDHRTALAATVLAAHEHPSA